MQEVLLLVSLDYGLVLVLSPSLFFYIGVQVVMPTLTTLLADAAGEIFCDETPVFGAIL